MEFHLAYIIMQISSFRLLNQFMSNHLCRTVSLPSSVAVWAASDEAAFLHGRFIWSAWDVEELQSGQLRERIENDEQFLRIGVHGI